MKTNKENRTKWLHIRVTEKEYEQVLSAFKKTTDRKISDYIRKIILGKPHIGVYRNASLDEFMAEAARLRKDLNGVANNFNQVVHKLHTLDHFHQLKTWFVTYELEKNTLFNRIAEIRNHIAQLGKLWLQ